MTTATYRLAIGRRIAYARALRGSSQQSLADSIGVSVSSIRSWESGVACPPSDVSGEIAAHLRCSVEWLIGRPMAEGDLLLVDRRAESLLLASKALDSDTIARSMRIGLLVGEDVMAVSLNEWGETMRKAHEHLARLREAGKNG